MSAIFLKYENLTIVLFPIVDIYCKAVLLTFSKPYTQPNRTGNDIMILTVWQWGILLMPWRSVHI